MPCMKRFCDISAAIIKNYLFFSFMLFNSTHFIYKIAICNLGKFFVGKFNIYKSRSCYFKNIIFAFV